MINFVHTELAPAAVGPYSQATKVGNMIFISGQIPLNPKTMQIESSTAAEQSETVLTNLLAILTASGAGLNHVVKATVYLKNMGDYAAVNRVYEKFFGNHKPARVCIEVSRLPRDVLVEIDAIAVV